MKYISTIFIFVLATSVFGQINALSDSTLSDSSRISLLTVSPGKELYSAFGHTGIRITDHKNNFDVVFNYGTFDFDQPGFYTNFVKGKMRYMITADRFEDFMREYVYEKRSIAEQTLNLTVLDKQKIFSFLYDNALPENREYYYDFFWDNCATRPRDVFESILGKRLKYHTDSASFEKNKTMHDILRVCVGNRPWVDYGFDLVLGLPCEIIASPRDQTFLPAYLANYISCATVEDKPFVTKKEFLVHFPAPKIETSFRPIHLSTILAFLACIIWIMERRLKTHFYIFDFVLFISVGLLGIFFLCLWFFTSHYAVPKNLNLLWLIPSHAIVAFLLLKKRKPKWLNFYFIGTGILMMLLFIGWQWLPQHYNLAVMPLILLLSFRSALIVKDLRSN
jgi:hypothetical protein